MRTYRRIEISAFRHRVTLVYAKPDGPTYDNKIEPDVLISDAVASGAVAPDSAEGKRILTEAIDLLRECLGIARE
jgi:hypothetical protein